MLDLVTTYPRRWVDRTNEARIADLVPGEEALVLVSGAHGDQAADAQPAHDGQRRRSATASGRMDVVFFNQPWREKQLQEGLQIALFGKADTYRGGLQMTNPIVDLIGDRTGRIVPIYPQSEKAQLNTWEMAGWVEEALRRCHDRGIADPVPDGDPPAARARRSRRGARDRSTRPSRCATRTRPAGGWRSTSCCGCSSCW